MTNHGPITMNPPPAPTGGVALSRPTKSSNSEQLTPADTAPLSGRFFASASHDIRTALNGIVGMTQLISDTGLTPEQKDCVDTISRSTEGLLKTINHALDIAKLESGQMELAETTCDPRELTNDLFRRLRPAAALKGVDFDYECEEQVPLSIMCDAALLERLLENLLENTLKRADQGSITLKVKCAGKSLNGAELSFQIVETRPEADDAPPPNARGSQTDPDLAVCELIIGLMGGELKFSNGSQRATRSVNITLRQANNPAPMKLPGSSADKTIPSGTRVLVAEDNKLNQMAVASILRKAGCDVHTAGDGEDAIRKCEDHLYDLILMDCQMPVMDGFEATARIRALKGPRRDIPIIALTANSMKGDKQKCFDSGMNEYLLKPIGRQDLIDSINRRVRSKTPVTA